MKSSKTRRILMLLGCAVLLVCLSVGATLAYLTSQTDPVVNTFTVGNVQITLDERDVDVYGVPVPSASPERVTANEYKLMPGHKYMKDPKIHVAAGSEACYLFVKVVNGIAGLEAPDVEGETPTSIKSQMDQNGWVELDGISNVYYYNFNIHSTNGVAGVVDARTEAKHVPVFEQIILRTDANDYFNQYPVDESKGVLEANITVQAYAVQADGFDTAADAYDAAPLWGVRNPNP